MKNQDRSQENNAILVQQTTQEILDRINELELRLVKIEERFIVYGEYINNKG